MDIDHNFALFKDNEKVIMIESFNNEVFEVMLGTLEKFEKIADINATTTEELNKKLKELVENLVLTKLI